MARLEAVDGGWLELTPVGWQFSGHTENDYDANWLEVEFEAHLDSELQVDRRSAPAFLTWELLWFVRASALLTEGGELALLAGLEPCLTLEATLAPGNNVAVEVGLALEFAPYSREPLDEPFEKTILVTRDAFRRFVERLADELAPFPQRTAEG